MRGGILRRRTLRRPACAALPSLLSCLLSAMPATAAGPGRAAPAAANAAAAAADDNAPLHPRNREGLVMIGRAHRLFDEGSTGRTGVPVSAAAIIELLNAPDPDLARGAAVALRQWWSQDASIATHLAQLVRAYRASRDPLLSAELWPFLFETYYEALPAADREAAVQALRATFAFNDLHGWSINDDATTRATVETLRGLTHLGLESPAAYDFLRRLAASEIRPLAYRRVAAWGMAISAVADRSAAQRTAMSALLRDRQADRVLRRYAARSLAGLRDRAAVDTLLDCALGDDDAVRASCAQSLVWLLRFSAADAGEPAAAPGALPRPAAGDLQRHTQDRVEAALARPPAEPGTLAQLLHLAWTAALPAARGQQPVLRLLSHPHEQIVALACDWLQLAAFDADGRPDPGLLDALAGWLAQAPTGERARPYVAALLTSQLERLDAAAIEALPSRHWKPLRRAVAEAREAERLSLAQAPDGKLQEIEYSLLADADAPAWEDGPRFFMRAPAAAADQTPGPRGVARSAALPDLMSTQAWRNHGLPAPVASCRRCSRLASGQLVGVAADGATDRVAERVNLALDRAGDTLSARAAKLASEHPAAAAGGAVLLLALLLGHGLSLGYYALSRRPWRLAQLSLALRQHIDRRTRLPVLGMLLRPHSALRLLLGLGLVDRRAKVLDAWVLRHLPLARQRFETLPAVASRSLVVERPVAIDDGRPQSALRLDDARRLLAAGDEAEAPRRRVLVIHGDGGSGKTTLACQLARWASGATAAERLDPRRPWLPVLVDRDWMDGATSDVETALLDQVRHELQRLVDGRGRVDRELARQLLEQGHVLLIVDHLSEMGDAARGLLKRVDHADFPVARLVLTSRLREAVRDARRVHAPLIRGEASAAEFYWTFVRAEHERLFGEPLTDARYRQAEARQADLRAIIRERDVSLLLVKLFADYAVASLDGDGRSGHDAPRSVPQVMQWHVRHAAHDAAQSEQAVPTWVLRDDTFADAKIVAWECLRQHWTPGPANKPQLHAALARRAAAAAAGTRLDERERLEWLQAKANLVRPLGFGATDKIVFVLDPLAEYMAAFHLVDDFRSGGALLRACGAELAALDPAHNGLRAALDDCLRDEFGFDLAEALRRLPAPAPGA